MKGLDHAYDDEGTTENENPNYMIISTLNQHKLNLRVTPVIQGRIYPSTFFDKNENYLLLKEEA